MLPSAGSELISLAVAGVCNRQKGLVEDAQLTRIATPAWQAALGNFA